MGEEDCWRGFQRSSRHNDLPGDISLDALAVKRDQEVAHRAREFIKVNRSSAIIGTPGAGKTTLSRAVIHSLERNRKGLPPCTN